MAMKEMGSTTVLALKAGKIKVRLVKRCTLTDTHQLSTVPNIKWSILQLKPTLSRGL